MVEKVKNEHYAPKRYLKHFANGENFFVFDKEKTEKRPGNVENYACERFFMMLTSKLKKKKRWNKIQILNLIQRWNR